MGTTVGIDFGGRVGPDRIAGLVAAAGNTNFTMAALNTGWCARFTALSTLDIVSVTIRWANVTAGGTIRLRIETVDTTTGKPTGTLYDANATIDFTPTAGIQTVTFAVAPSTGLTVGTEYCFVLLTTVAGSIHSLTSHVIQTGPARLPVVVLTATDGTTRSNFNEVTGAPVPTISWTDSAGNEVADFCNPYGATTNNWVFGSGDTAHNWVIANKITVQAPIGIAGIQVDSIAKQGTPIDGLRCRLWSGVGSLGTTITPSPASISGVSATRGMTFITSAVLAAGTYYVGLDSFSSTTSSNSWLIKNLVPLTPGLVPSNCYLSESNNDGASWTDNVSSVAPIAFLVNTFQTAGAPAGGSNFYPVGTGLFRGMI